MQISNEEYKQLKPLLFSIGYRMLGSVADAEDIVQETFLKAYQIDDEKIDNKKAYLCRIMTNRSLDVLKSSKYKRETYIGPWNPEPLLLQSMDLDPAEVLLQKEGLSIAYLRMMEHLSPNERAILLLREVFDFSYSEIAHIIDKKEENCRKVFSRAKQKIASVEGESLDYEKNLSIINRFIEAFQMQNIDTLLKLLSKNITLYSDGGGKVKAAVRPIASQPNVLSLLYGIIKIVPEDFSSELNNVNGQPAIVNYSKNQIHSIISFYIRNDLIEEIYIMMNPDKLPLK